MSAPPFNAPASPHPRTFTANPSAGSRLAAGLCALWLAAAASPSVAATDAERIAAYQEFRALFDAGNYAAALPIAENLASQTEAQYGKESRELVNPLANVASTHYRLGNRDTAEALFKRSVQLIEGKAPGADRLLIRPLHGLGESYLEAEQYAEASVVLKRAVDLSRNLDGLFNLQQLEYLDPLIEAYIGQDRLADAEKESQYAFRVAESAFGRGDLRMLEPLDRYARWFEFVGRYTTARGLHARALQIAENQKGRNSVEGVPALRGLARSYYLEFIFGPEESESGSSNDPGTPVSSIAQAPPAETGRLNPDGERALRLALEALGKQDPVNKSARGETLVDLADWYLIGAQRDKALNAYREGWSELNSVGPDALKPLIAPRRLAYRPPSASIARARPSDPENFEERFVEVSFKVGVDGKVSDVVTVATDAPPAIEKATQFAARKARYSPRLENGEPVVTDGVTFRERVLVRTPKAPAT
jgi:hypothetical protein